MHDSLAQNAINFALANKWKDAINANLEILESDKEDLEALNRLAHAYFADGNVKKAKAKSQEVLKIDPNNSIALKSLAKFNQGANRFSALAANLFIEEPGKTKLTALINLGSEKICSCLNTGDEVLLSPHAHKVSVVTAKGDYVGKLTDDLSARLRIHLKNGTKYKVLVKSAGKSHVKVFIKGDVVSFARESLKSLGEFGS